MSSPSERRARVRLGLLTATGAFLSLSCSSGLEGIDPKGTVPPPALAESTNLRFGFDPCVALTDPITGVDVAGGVIPTLVGSRERPIAFFAFATRTQIADVDDPVTDANGVQDVFVAAVDSNRIDPYAFTYSIAGTMRHTRCVTCHQMNIDVVADPGALAPTPFLTQNHFNDGGGAPPLNQFNDETCKTCHFPDWFSPGPSFDLRRSGTRDLFIRAQVPPSGLEEHFSTDPRVLWALGNGQTPFGGAADDDHGGVDEPEDRDGTRRHAPGGTAAFLERLRGWLDTEDPVTGELKFSSAEDAVQDVILASRSAGGATAGNGVSRAPSLVFVPDLAFDPVNPTLFRAGSLHVAFESDASDMVGGTTNVATDVFKVRIDVFVTANDTIDLVYSGSQTYVSEAFDGADANGNSTAPDIGGDGSSIAYVSDAFSLVNGLPANCRPEVFLYDGVNRLVSHVPGDFLQPGNAGAVNPRISADGAAVSFESDATDLVAGDTNGTRDVFYALASTLNVARASVTDAGGEFSGHSHGASLFHSGGDVKVAFATQEAALPAVVGVQCPDVVVPLMPTKDTHVREDDPNASFEPDPFPPIDQITMMPRNGFDLYVGTTGAGAGFERRSLVAFDVAGMIPAGSTINAVTLTMVANQEAQASCGAGAGPQNNLMRLHAMNVDWPEVGSTWNNVFGDNDPGVSAQELVTGTGVITWDTTSALEADVQGWLDNPSSNFGWMIIGTDAACTGRRLDSIDHAAPAVLSVDYTPPPPGPLALSGGIGASTVYLRDTAVGRTFDLNQAVDPAGAIAPVELDVDMTPLLANATNPVISPNGNAVLFESMAQNLDTVRRLDENRLMDVMLADLMQLDAQGFILPYTLSVTADGGCANGPSHSPLFGAFNPPTDAFPLGLAVYATDATNLGNTDPGDLDGDGVPEESNYMVSFLNEGGSVLANFEADPARQGMNRGVVFESKSSGRPTSFEWDFGDGTPTSNEQRPTHAYTTPGLYTVKLTVSGDLGMDERTRIEYVHVLGPVVVTFSTTKDTSQAPLQGGAANIPDTASVAGAIDDNDPTSALLFDMDSSLSTEFPDQFTWTLTPVDDMGMPTAPAATVSSDANPVGVAIDSTGLYDLTLDATGPGGSGSATQRLEVYQKVDASFTTNPAGAIVRGPANFMVQFTDTSTGDLLDTTPHFWVFGDGNTSTLANPANTYAEGLYFARLTVSGKGLDSSQSVSVPVIADGAITSAFTPTPQPVGSTNTLLIGYTIDDGGGALVDFMNESANQAGDPLFYRWDFGTGGLTGQETVENPSGIQYDLADPENVEVFSIDLVASKNNPAPVDCLGQPVGTCDFVTGFLVVYPLPMVDFDPPAPSFQTAPNRPPHTVSFSGQVIGDGLGTNPSYRWLRSERDMPGASIEFATGLTPMFEFADPGTYKVALEVETEGPGGVRQVVRSAERDVVVSASTLTQWYTQAVDPLSGARCTNCHKGLNPPADLNWLGTPAEIFERIVEDAMGNPVFSTRCNTSQRRIEPGNPDASVVYNVLLDPSGPLCNINMRINLPGVEADKDLHVAVLRSWILGGGLNN